MIFEALSAIYVNARVVRYPDGSSLVMVADRPIFRRPGFELASDAKRQLPADRLELERISRELQNPELEMARLEHEGKALELADAADADNRRRAARRAKSALRDLVRSNEWDYFVTLTLDPAKVDRYDMAAVTRKLSQWADNQVRRHGLAYVLVPELHRDGAVHFHGFFRGPIRAVDSGTLTAPGKRPRRPRSEAERRRMLADGWQPVFNLPGWTLGFTTAIRPYGDVDAAAAYIVKYITKEVDGSGKIGGRWYYSGGDLRRPSVTFGEGDVDAAAQVPGAWSGEIPALGAKLVMCRTDKTGCPVNGTAKNAEIPYSELEGGEDHGEHETDPAGDGQRVDGRAVEALPDGGKGTGGHG